MVVPGIVLEQYQEQLLNFADITQLMMEYAETMYIDGKSPPICVLRRSLPNFQVIMHITPDIEKMYNMKLYVRPKHMDHDVLCFDLLLSSDYLNRYFIFFSNANYSFPHEFIEHVYLILDNQKSNAVPNLQG